ncbi:MAG: hypothetical protein Q8L98_08650 [Chlamydiales bacterium]|nr:hypothetical protein [Chlamydiales bacterium]
MKVTNAADPISPISLVTSDDLKTLVLTDGAKRIHETLGDQFRKVQAQAPQCLGNFSKIVGKAGADLSNLNKITVSGGSIGLLAMESKLARTRIVAQTQGLLENRAQCTTSKADAKKISEELSTVLNVPFEKLNEIE